MAVVGLDESGPSVRQHLAEQWLGEGADVLLRDRRADPCQPERDVRTTLGETRSAAKSHPAEAGRAHPALPRAECRSSRCDRLRADGGRGGSGSEAPGQRK